MIYVDANVLVHSVMDFGTKGKAARKLMGLIDDDAFEAMTSSLTMDEFMWVFIKSGRKDSIRKAVTGFYESKLDVVPVTSQAPLNACSFVERFGLGPRDALHCAVMKENHVKEIITEDKHFDNVDNIGRHPIKGFTDKFS